MRMRFPIFGLDEGVFKGSQSVYMIELLFFNKFMGKLALFSHDQSHKRLVWGSLPQTFVSSMTFW